MKREIHPPGWAVKLLRHLHPTETLEETEGDLEELYAYWHQRVGKRQANMRYLLAVLSVLPPFVRHRKPKPTYIQTSFLHFAMIIGNYFKIALRNLVKHKGYSFINILGLSLGLACSLLILLWVGDELGIDQFHTNVERIFLVMRNNVQDGSTGSDTPSLLAENLKNDFPEVEQAAAMTYEETILLTAGNISGKEKGRYTNEDFLTIFSYPLLLGDARTALDRPDAIVLSHKLAQKYFPNQNPIGKLIRVDNQDVLMVTAVLDELPANSSLTFDYLLSFKRYLTLQKWAQGWDNSAFQTYVLVAKQVSLDKLTASIKDYLKLKTNNASWAADTQFFLHKNSDAYLYSTFTNGIPDGGRIEYVRLFMLIAFFILLIACFNFMNLATARAVKRAKEIGVRKVVGATRKMLMGQFISESLLISFLSLLLALVLVGLLLPAFRQVTGKPLPFPIGIYELVIAIGITLLTGLLAGSYPALFLSSLKPISVLKGVLGFKPVGALFRKSLVVFQFCLSFILMVGMIVIYSQIHYIRTKHVGFNKENLVYLPLEGELKKNYEAFRSELLRQPGIKAVACSWSEPILAANGTTGISWPGKDPNQLIRFEFTAVDYDYIRTMDIGLAAGRAFSLAYSMDTANYMINEVAAEKIGYKDPVGKELSFWGQKGVIVGVIKNYHHNSMHVAIEPLILRMQRREYAGFVLVRIEDGQTEAILSGIEETFHTFNPKYPFEYKFTDQEFGRFYTTEMIIGKLATYFAILAIFISCLGLFGLATFTAEQRTKEIGVRKVLGATIPSIVALLSKDFVKLVFLAIVIGSPIAVYAMNRWLEDFTYHINMDWWMFALASLLALSIAVVTVSFQSIKAALSNPVKSLRNE